jgi:plastocyanin
MMLHLESLMRICITLALLTPLAGCGSETPSGPADAAPGDGGGSGAANVMAVTCPSTVPLTVSAGNADMMFNYTPSNAPIPVGSVVKFVMGTIHTVEADVRGSDPAINVGLGQTRCLKFNKTGTFGFHCQPHGFPGTVTIQ